MTRKRLESGSTADLASERERRERIGRERAAKAPPMWAEEDFSCDGAEALLPGLSPAPPVRLRRLVPTAGARELAPILFVHGGGWAFGSIEASLGLSRKLAELFGRPVVSVGYRLAPEHPFPAALEDVKTALACVRPAAVVGASAGATLALQAITAAKADAPRHAVLFYGVWKCPSRAKENDSALTPSALRKHLERYAPGQEEMALRVETSHLPAAFHADIVCGEKDILFEANQQLAMRLGRRASFHPVPDRGHGFVNRWAEDRRSEQLLERIYRRQALDV